MKDLYALGLTAVMTLGGCAKNEMLNKTETTPTANVSKQKKEYLEDGVYRGVVDGKPAEYKVYENGNNCYLWLRVSDSKLIWIRDSNCDNTVDGVEMIFPVDEPKYDSSDLERVGRTENFDALLREGRKLVRPENNQTKRDLQKAIDDLLQP